MSKISIQLDYYLQAFRLHQGLTKHSNLETRALLRKAISGANAEDNLPRAYGLLSFTIQTAWLCNWITQPEANTLLAHAVADVEAFGGPAAGPISELKALKSGDPVDTIAKAAILAYAAVAAALDNDDYDNRWSLGTASLYNGDFPKAFSEYDAATTLATSRDTPAVCVSSLKVDHADLLFFAGKDSPSNSAADYTTAIGEAIVMTQQAIANNPNDPKHFRWNWTLGWAYYELAAYEEPAKNSALSLATLLQLRNPHQLILRNIIASAVACGKIEAARKFGGELLKIDPDYNVAIEDRWPYRDPDQRCERFKIHLRGADLPG